MPVHPRWGIGTQQAGGADIREYLLLSTLDFRMARYGNLREIKVPQATGIYFYVSPVGQEIDSGLLQPHHVVLDVQLLQCADHA